MRIIDANEYAEEVCRHCSIRSSCKSDKSGTIRRSCFEMKLISYQPTIEAIPIEWIEKHYLKIDASLYNADNCVIENMLIDWLMEKENG